MGKIKKKKWQLEYNEDIKSIMWFWEIYKNEYNNRWIDMPVMILSEILPT